MLRRKYTTFSVPISKEFDNGKIITYKLNFIDGFSFILTSLSKLVKYLSGRLHSDECTDCKSKLAYVSFKDNSLIVKCFQCEKNYTKDFNKELINKLANTHEFCNEGINKFIIKKRCLSLSTQFYETSLPDKKAFYGELNLKSIIDKDYTHAQKVFEELKLKDLGDYHDLYVQSDTLLLADVFEDFRNKCIEIHEPDLFCQHMDQHVKPV